MNSTSDRRRRGMAFLLALAACAALRSACAAEPIVAQGPAAPAFRLPAGARPLHYSLHLTVVPGNAGAAGEIAIDVELDRPHVVLWLNADDLKVTRAGVDRADTRVGVLDGHDQFVGLAFDPALAPGRHRVTLGYEAVQARNSTRGLFALEDHGAWYAMTQFEPVSARRAFPCFDEPGFKAPWQVTLRVPHGLVALSNSRVESTRAAGDGFDEVRFAETRPLPTYLVSFAVGPWETVAAEPAGRHATATRIVVPRGRTADAAFVARAYPELFARLETYFGIAYPFGKLDHVAIPLTVGFAMENAGLITYGSAGLLARPGADTPRFRRGAASVGTHEMAHQWFGNLVTTAWWDDIWLNEAFATWIAAKIVDEWRPDYDRGAGRITDRADAIDSDLLTTARQIRAPVAERGDIFNAFDSITYEKGATVIGMFERWLGEAAFRRGVQHYLAAQADGSATATDFLKALTQASDQPVARAFETFLNQNGVPQVGVRLQCDAQGARLMLAQQRLALLGSTAPPPQRWDIPVCVRYGGARAGAHSSRQACTLLTEASQALPLAGGCPAFVFANAGGSGYYVARYDERLLEGVARRRDALSPAEYASLLSDLRAGVRAGNVSAAEAMRWVRLAAPSRDRQVVVAAVDLAAFASNTLVDDAQRPAYADFVRRVFGPRARALGFAPKPGESDDDQLLRRSLLRLVAPEDPALAAEARRRAIAWLEDRRAIDPGLVDVTLMTSARTGDAALFDALLAEAKVTQDRLDRRNLTMALFAFGDPALAQRGLALLLDTGFDARESWAALRYSIAWNPARQATQEFILGNFDALVKSVQRDAPAQWPALSSGLCSTGDEEALARFWQARAATYSGAELQLAQTLESIRTCVRTRSSAGDPGFGS